ncbi:MAG: lipid kinase [Prevotella sp.]|nr:lipid kinase [Prevotella sp.]
MSVESTRWGILYCPKGSKKSSKKRWTRIDTCLKEHGVKFDFVQSENQGSVKRLINMLINNGYKTIVIVGGDSALNDAANCLMETDKETRETIALGLIPNGQMNDFAHYWDFKENEVEQTIEWLTKRRIRKIDVGCITYTDIKEEKHQHYFFNCINIGLVAAIQNLRLHTRRIFGSRTMSFVVTLFLFIFQRLEYKMHIKINTETIKRKLMTVCIGNASGYGLTPNAVPYNGLLDVSVVHHTEITQLFEGIYLFATGKILNLHSVHPYRTKEVTVEEDSKAMVSVDGIVIGKITGAFKINVEQEVINFLIPA